ncbi:hypothetical protein A3Q56_04975 [Intoshia linei]|uniref:Uncharacterized protein n=1 Tax=Intoshia linei TaxID=1819745 RepID=A0A177B0Y7_9BILA|nr:hypothetical protein A3Q56_04975 [Intoshia linei]
MDENYMINMQNHIITSLYGHYKTAKVQLIDQSETIEKETINMNNYQNFMTINSDKIKNCTLYINSATRLDGNVNKKRYLNQWLESTVEEHLRKCQETKKLKKDEDTQITNHSIEKILKM